MLSVQSSEAIVWFAPYLMNCHKTDPMGEMLGSLMAADILVAGGGALMYSTCEVALAYPRRIYFGLVCFRVLDFLRPGYHGLL